MHSINNEIKSYAKINIGLKILDLLQDGYHSICTIMQEIDFYDLIKITPNDSMNIMITCSGPIQVAENDSNLCVKAAQLIFNTYNCNHGVSIHSHSRKPNNHSHLSNTDTTSANLPDQHPGTDLDHTCFALGIWSQEAGSAILFHI